MISKRRIASLLLAAAVTFSATFSVSSPMTAGAASLSDLQNKLSRLQKEEQALKKELATYKNDLNKQQEYVKSLNSQIANTTQQIDLMMEQIESLEQQVRRKQEDIDQAEREIQQKQDSIANQFTMLRLRLRAIAKSGNLTSLQMLLSSDDYVEYLIKDKVSRRVSQHDQQLIDEMELELTAISDAKERLEQEKGQLEAQKQQIEELKAKADEKKRSQEAMYAEVNRVIKKLQSQMNTVAQELEKTNAEMEKLDKEIKRLIQNTKSTGNYTDGTMYWPVPAVRYISSPFGTRWGKLHRGIDIANSPTTPAYGQDIVAAADGVVIYTNKSGYGGGYGLYIVIDHGLDSKGRKITTLYAHCSKVLVSEGDKVVGGKTVIGKVGSTGNSTGPHLHFEVRVDGTAVDPIANGYVKTSK